MHFIDWIIVAVPMLIVLGIAWYTRRFLKSVADFMAGGRNAGRYLLCTARSEQGVGAVVFVAMFEMISNAGFTMGWWGMISIPVGLFVAITGFVIYRYRESRALTLAQFFEIRYSRKLRLFMGGLAFVAGIVNFGIIPVIGSRFFVYFLGLPQALHVLSVEVPTYIPLMGFFLTVTLILTLTGGQITVMIAHCVEGIMSQFFYVIVAGALLVMFKWSEISQALLDQPPGQSLMNPFDSMGLHDFNLWFVLMSVFVSVYGTMAWQNASAFNSAAATPHEARMGSILGGWRSIASGVMVTLLGICAITFLKHPDFAMRAAPVQGVLNAISDPQIQLQMRVPIALSYLLPVGIKGIVCAIILMGVFSGDGMHLHSWGSIFIQDVLVPLRKKPFTPKQHIRALRIGIIGVAIFVFVFGCIFRQTQYVMMWFLVTTAIYVGGAGAAIIGGLYWKKGTTTAAWAAILTGSTLSLGGILAQQFNRGFPLNGMQLYFFAVLCAISVYVVVSLLTCKVDFNMDRMLHRGRYALETAVDPVTAPQARRRFSWGKLIGFDENFTRGDKWIVGGLFWWSMLWFFVFLIGTVWNLIRPWSNQTWSDYWHYTNVILPFLIGIMTTVWFTIGGVRDLKVFFRRLREERVDDRDDGTVVGHHNLDEEGAIPEQSHAILPRTVNHASSRSENN